MATQESVDPPARWKRASSPPHLASATIPFTGRKDPRILPASVLFSAVHSLSGSRVPAAVAHRLDKMLVWISKYAAADPFQLAQFTWFAPGFDPKPSCRAAIPRVKKTDDNQPLPFVVRVTRVGLAGINPGL